MTSRHSPRLKFRESIRSGFDFRLALQQDENCLLESAQISMAPDADVAKPIFLTFDDGPCEPNTSQILEVLKKYNARATFFVCGRNAERYPEDVKRAASEGHAIGNHTYSHSP